MRSLVICILSWFVLLAISKGISVRALQSKDDVLMKKISDLQFQLFTSIQEREKIIKTAVFETQCSVSGCTFDVCDKRKSVHYWIDLTDIGKEGKWIAFATGKGPAYTAWGRRQPDNSGGNQDCANNNWSKLGDWDDENCMKRLQVMCEASRSGF